MTVMDLWKACRHHLPMGHKKMLLFDFTSILARDCLENQFIDKDPSTVMLTIPGPAEAGAVSSVSSATCDGFSFLSPEQCRHVDSFDSPKEVFGSCETHHKLFQTEEREERTNRRVRGRCQRPGCAGKTSWHCRKCVPRTASKAWYCDSRRFPDCHQYHKQIAGYLTPDSKESKSVSSSHSGPSGKGWLTMQRERSFQS